MNECSISRLPSFPLTSGNEDSSASRTLSMADAAITTTSASCSPVTGPEAVIRTHCTPLARAEAPDPASTTDVTIVDGTSVTRPVRSARRSGISADGRATTGQPKLLQNPQLSQACWPLYPLTELAAIGNGNGCMPNAVAPADTTTDERICGPGGIGYGAARGACLRTMSGNAVTSPCTPSSCSTSS